MGTLIRPGQRVLTLDSSVLISRRAVTAPAGGNWYTVAGKTTRVAYQPKSAASQSASYTNLANPGTNDITVVTAPTWASGSGWSLNGIDQYLTTIGNVASADTYAVRVANHSSGNIFGKEYARIIGIAKTYNYIYFYNCAAATEYLYGTTAGVFVIAGRDCYYNGSLVVTLGTALGEPGTDSIAIGAKLTWGSPEQWMAGDIHAFAIWDGTLSSGEVATVSAAMAAL